MPITKYVDVRVLAFWGLLVPTPVLSQPAEACGIGGDLLFYCTFETQQVGVCLTRSSVSYSFGTDWASPELTLSQSAVSPGYFPNVSASPMLNESITFFNDDTSYEISTSARLRDDPDAITDGRVIVTLPNGEKQQLSCDVGSVIPRDPRNGLGILGAFYAEDRMPVLWRCIDNALVTQDCIGFVRDLDLQQQRCDEAQDPSGCWATESDTWDRLVTANYDWISGYVFERQGEAFAATLRDSQTSWERSRDLDCQISGSWPLPPLPDAGQAFCRANHSAQRLQFLHNVKLFSEANP